MSFLAPSLLLGLIAAVLPFFIHRIGRRRARPLSFAAMELLLRAERQVAARRRLRNLLLLLVRTGAAAALPLLFARPYAEVRSDLPAAAHRPQTAVMVLDDSASLQRRPGGLGAGAPLFEAARSRARTLLENLAPESDVALVLASEGTPTPVAEPSSDRARLAAALDAASCSGRRGDLGAALARAAQIAGTGGHTEKRIYLISDLQATGFAADRFSPPAGVAVTVLPVGEEAWENRAVTDLAAEPAPEAGAQGVAVTAEIANFSAQPASHLGITLEVDAVEVARGFVDVPAGGRVKKRFLHAFAGGGAAHEAAVRIDGDALALDDARLARLEVSRGLRVLVVNGDPRTVRNEDEAFFLEAALRAGGSRFEVQVGMPDELVTRNLDAYAAVFMVNVARPTADEAAALVRYVEAGGGVFISVGEKVDADAWNERLRRILPQPLGLRRTAAAHPGAPEGETVDTRPAERLAPIDRRHPLLAGFPAGGEGLASARFFQFLLLEPVADSSGRAVVLRYESGAPALVEAQVGRGRVLLLTSTIDREWTDLPIRPGFLPLMQEAARRLAGAPSGDAVSALLVGAEREISAAPDDRRIEVGKPGGGVRALVPEARTGAEGSGGDGPGGGGRSVIFRETDQVGVYRVRAVRASGVVSDRPDETFVVNVDVRESDPAILPPERRPDRLAAGGDRQAQSPMRRLELWHLLGAALVAFLLVESILTLRVRRHLRAEQATTT
jgi:hypothetical protein